MVAGQNGQPMDHALSHAEEVLRSGLESARTQRQLMEDDSVWVLQTKQ